MWDFFRHYVRQLVLVVVLAGFMDMLLPSGQIRKFAQVVVGLFIIMVLVNPLLSLFRPHVAWRLPELESDTAAWNEISSGGDGAALTATVEEQVFRRYQRRLEEQAEALVLSVEGINQVRAKVLIETEVEHPNFGGIGGIEVWVGPGDGEEDRVQVVDKIEVVVSSGKDKEGWNYTDGRVGVAAEMEDRITSLLTAFFSLEPQLISIFALEGEGF